jgi:predicted HTH domain antitoxin
MTIELPDKEIGTLQLTPEKVRVELAVGLYAGRQVTLGRAAKIAGISYTAFMHEIGRRGICLNYSVEAALHDMEMADELSSKAGKA